MKLVVIFFFSFFAAFASAVDVKQHRSASRNQGRDLAQKRNRRGVGDRCKRNSHCRRKMYCNSGRCARDGTCNDDLDCLNPANRLRKSLREGEGFLKCVPNKSGRFARKNGRDDSVGRCVRDMSTGNRCPAEMQPPAQCRRKACSKKDCDEGAKKCVDRNCGSCGDVVYFNATGDQVCIPPEPMIDMPMQVSCDTCPSGRISNGCITCVCGEACPRVGCADITVPFCVEDEPDCSAVSCVAPSCPGDVDAITPEGECCPVCPEVEVGCDTCPSGRFNDGCNTCVCGDGGVAACTRIFCPVPGEPFCLEDEPEPEVGVGCETCPSGRFNDGCNTCFCGEDGVAACTRVACLGNREPFCINDEE